MIIIRLSNSSPQQIFWAERDRNTELRTGTGDLSEVAVPSRGQRVVVLLPAEDVVLTTATIPGSAKRARQAVPFALEENFAVDIDDLHFAVGSRLDADVLPVAVISKEKMAVWQSLLKDAGINADILAAETQALPWKIDTWMILVDGSRALLRFGRDRYYVVDTINLAGFMECQTAAFSPAVAGGKIAIELLGGADRDILPLELRQSAVVHELEGVAGDGAFMPLLANGFAAKECINLLQGEYSLHAEWENVIKVWLPATILLVVFLLLQGGLKWQQYAALKQTSSALSERSVAIYRETFPEARNIVDPRAQMAHQLKLLDRQGAGAGFLYLVEKCGPVLIKATDLQVKNLRFGDGNLILDIEMTSLKRLNELQDELATATGLDVEIRTASSADDRISARLKIGEKS